MTPETNWSAELQQQTRNAINELRVSPFDGLLHFKNHDGHFSALTLNHLLSGRLTITDKQSAQIYDYANVDALIDAGWAID